MSGKRDKKLRRKAEELLIEWLRTMVPEGEDTSKINDNWDGIKWSKPKKKEVKPKERDLTDLYLNDKNL